jgi:hypothetical protein
MYATAEQLEALRNKMMSMHKRLSTNLTYLAKLADRQVVILETPNKYSPYLLLVFPPAWTFSIQVEAAPAAVEVK